MKFNSKYDLAVQFCKVITEHTKLEQTKPTINFNKPNYTKKKALFTEFGDTFTKEQKVKK